MKVLLTGGAGYIGSVMSRMLLEKGYDVIILDKLFFGTKPIEDIMDKVKVIKADTRDYDPDVLNGVDAVIDLAALSNDPSGELDPNLTLEINYKARVRTANLAKKKGVKRYLLPSSCSVYGFQTEIVDEDSPVNPLTTYAKANVLAEKDILPLADKNFVAGAFRIATVFGFSYRMRFDLAVNGMARSLIKEGKIGIMRDGTQYRPFIHVRDVVRGFMIALEADEELINGKVYNLGSNELNVQIFQLAERVAKGCNREFNYYWYGSPDKRSYRVKFDRVLKALNFTTTVTIEEGAREVCEAIESGKLDPDDPTTITVSWYKKIIQERGSL